MKRTKSYPSENNDVASNESVAGSLKKKFLWVFIPIAIVLAVAAVSVRYYQQWAAWDFGLDATLAEFDTYWMTLLYAEVLGIGLIGVVAWAWLWLSRDRNLDLLEPKEELYRYFKWIGLIAGYVFALYWAASFFAEQDASWHQTVVRDTSFTPSHIPLFYGAFPTFIVLGFSVLLYAMTRLPVYAHRISVPVVVAVVGPFLLLPNVAFNEWGHAFWNAEEIFSLPLHWGFVVFGWAVLALGGVFAQILNRLVSIWPEMFPEDDKVITATTEV